MSPWTRVARLAGRLTLTALGLGAGAVVGIQFEGIVAKNIAVGTELRASRTQIVSLIAREAVQRRTIARLRSPLGSIPEIHDKLRFVGPNEEIIYIRGAASESQTPHRWNESQ